MNTRGVVGKFGSANYIPFPKKLNSGKNLLNYKQAFIDTWKDYYVIASRRQEEEDIQKYNEYIEKTFGFLKEKKKQEWIAKANAAIAKVNAIYEEQVKEINERYGKLIEQASDEPENEGTEFGSVNLSFAFLSEKDELQIEKQRELKGVEIERNNQILNIETDLALILPRYDISEIFDRLRYDYMRDVVEDKIQKGEIRPSLRRKTPAPVSLFQATPSTFNMTGRPPPIFTPGTYAGPIPLYGIGEGVGIGAGAGAGAGTGAGPGQYVEERMPLPFAMVGERPMSEEERIQNQKAKLAAILAAKQRRYGGSRQLRRMTKGKSKGKKHKKTTRKY